MSRELIAATPSPCGWFWRSRRNSWPWLARQRRRRRRRPRANQVHEEAPHKKKAHLEKSIGRLVAGGSGLHVAPGIDRRVVHAHFVVNVWAGGAAADAGIAHHFAALDPRSGNSGESREVRVP